MALPVTIPNAFANATASIPLSQLDANFNTLANAVNGISDGSETLANVTATVANITTANVGALNTSGPVVFNDAGADVDFRVEGDTDANLLFVDASTDRVGIGTNAPAVSGLEISKATGSATPTPTELRLSTTTNASDWSTTDPWGRISFYNADTSSTGPRIQTSIQTISTDTVGGRAALAFSTAGSSSLIEAMRIDQNQNVGIGTSTPGSFQAETDSKLTVGTGSGNTGAMTLYSATTGHGSINWADGTSGASTYAGVLRYDHSLNAMQFYTNGLNERMRIDSSGNLLVNIQSTQGTKFAADGGSGGAVWGRCSTTGTAVNITWNSATSGDNLFEQFYVGTGPSLVGSIDYNRGAGLTRYNTTSDATLKNILGNSDGAKSVEILNSTRIREFAWKDDETQKTQIGVIAQELYETYKGAVSVGGDVEKERDVTEEVEEEYTDENGETQTRTVTKVVGKETYTEYRPWAVDKTAFTFHLVAGWQAHEKLIKQQAETIAALEARIAALENA